MKGQGAQRACKQQTLWSSKYELRRKKMVKMTLRSTIKEKKHNLKLYKSVNLAFIEQKQSFLNFIKFFVCPLIKIDLV